MIKQQLKSVALVLYYGPESPRFWSGDWVAFCELPIKLPPWLRNFNGPT